jgi:hypothetical protein
LHCHSSKDFVVAVDAVAEFRKILVLSFPQLQLFCTVLASKTLQTLPKEEDEEEGKTQQSCWVGSKSFAACLLCTRFSVNWTEKDLRRSEQQLLHSSPGDLCNPSKQSPPKKPRGKKKRNNKNCKNLTSSSLSLSPPKENTKTSKQKHPQILQNKKQSQKPQKHTQLPQNSPPTHKNQQQKNVCTKFSEHSFASTICHNYSPKFTNPPKSVN